MLCVSPGIPEEQIERAEGLSASLPEPKKLEIMCEERIR